jgi:hypothetical protein
MEQTLNLPFDSNNLASILQFLQLSLKAPKDKQSNGGMKYSYRTADGILIAYKEIVDKYKLPVYLSTNTDIVNVNEYLFVKITVALHLITDINNKVEAVAFAMHSTAPKGMSEPQSTGSSTTYAKKYALCNLFGVDDSKDDPDTSLNVLQKEIMDAESLQELLTIKQSVNDSNLKNGEVQSVLKSVNEKIYTQTTPLKNKFNIASTRDDLATLYKAVQNNQFFTKEERDKFLEEIKAKVELVKAKEQ